MIGSNFHYLRRQKAPKENRDLPIHVIAAEAGLYVGTVHKVSTSDINGVRISTIDALCRYFGVSNSSEMVKFTS